MAGGCALKTGEPDALTDPGPEIKRLREAIREDHAKLEALVSSTQSGEAEDLYRSPEVQLLAEQLNLHRKALKRLEAQQRAVRP